MVRPAPSTRDLGRSAMVRRRITMLGTLVLVTSFREVQKVAFRSRAQAWILRASHQHRKSLSSSAQTSLMISKASRICSKFTMLPMSSPRLSLSELLWRKGTTLPLSSRSPPNLLRRLATRYPLLELCRQRIPSKPSQPDPFRTSCLHRGIISRSVIGDLLTSARYA